MREKIYSLDERIIIIEIFSDFTLCALYDTYLTKTALLPKDCSCDMLFPALREKGPLNAGKPS